MISTVPNRLATVPMQASRLRLVKPWRLLRLPLILLLAVGFAVTNISVSSAGSEITDAQLTYVSVQAGDSLWSLAERYSANQDPQDWIYELVRLNGLSSAQLEPGQRLALPN